MLRKREGPVVDGEEQVNVASFGRGGCFVGSPKREKLTFPLKLDPSVPLFSQSTLAVDNVRLAEDGGLPKANIRLWKVAKIFHFLATFQVHPWTILTFHEPVPRRVDWPGKLVQEPLCGS
jgi:hypothetical protein